MKLLIATSFRPFGFSKNNDSYQHIYLNSLMNLNCDLTICATQFDDDGVEKFLKNSGINYIYNNISRHRLPDGKKYSNQIVFKNALQEFCKIESSYDFFIYSCTDILMPANLKDVLLEQKNSSSVYLIYPNTLIKNGKIFNYYNVIYGIDLIIFRLDKSQAQFFLKIIEDWRQYDWGINENFLLAISDLLNLPIFNLIKKMDLVKFENNFSEIKEDRSWQINSWKENQIFLINFLKKYNLSILYAKGSYYYLLYKIFNFKDLNFRLFIIYIKFFLYYLPKNIFKFSKWKNFFI
jgi:hypothetical protein